MVVTAAWAALIIAAFLWELCCHLAAHRWAILVEPQIATTSTRPMRRRAATATTNRAHPPPL